MESVARYGVERVMAQRVSSELMRGPADGAACQREDLRRMEVTMRFFDSTSVVMVLIMAGVFAPISVIHFLATSVFH
jgi:hypothetical protein